MSYQNIPTQIVASQSVQPDTNNHDQTGLRFSKVFWALYLTGIILFPVGLILNSTTNFLSVGKPSFSQLVQFFGVFFFLLSLVVLFINNSARRSQRILKYGRSSVPILLSIQQMSIYLAVYWSIIADSYSSGIPSVLIASAAFSAAAALTITLPKSTRRNLVMLLLLVFTSVLVCLLLLFLATSSDLVRNLLLIYTLFAIAVVAISLFVISVLVDKHDENVSSFEPNKPLL